MKKRLHRLPRRCESVKVCFRDVAGWAIIEGIHYIYLKVLYPICIHFVSVILSTHKSITPSTLYHNDTHRALRCLLNQLVPATESDSVTRHMLSTLEAVRLPCSAVVLTEYVTLVDRLPTSFDHLRFERGLIASDYLGYHLGKTSRTHKLHLNSSVQ